MDGIAKKDDKTRLRRSYHSMWYRIRAELEQEKPEFLPPIDDTFSESLFGILPGAGVEGVCAHARTGIRRRPRRHEMVAKDSGWARMPPRGLRSHM